MALLQSGVGRRQSERRENCRCCCHNNVVARWVAVGGEWIIGGGRVVRKQQGWGRGRGKGDGRKRTWQCNLLHQPCFHYLRALTTRKLLLVFILNLLLCNFCQLVLVLHKTKPVATIKMKNLARCRQSTTKLSSQLIKYISSSINLSSLLWWNAVGCSVTFLLLSCPKLRALLVLLIDAPQLTNLIRILPLYSEHKWAQSNQSWTFQSPAVSNGKELHLSLILPLK